MKSYRHLCRLVAVGSLLLCSFVFAQESLPQVSELTETDGFNETLITGESILTIDRLPGVGATVDARIQVTVDTALRAGDRIVIAQHWLDEDRLQNESSGSAAFVAPQRLTGFESGYVARTGTYGGLESVADSVAFTVIGDELGNRVLFDIKKLTLPRQVRDYRLKVFVERGDLSSELTSNVVRLVSGQFQQISISADSLVRPGESVDVRIALLDQFGNVVEGRTASLDLLVNGAFRQRVDVAGGLTRISDVQFEVPGTYQLELRTGGGGIRAFSNPIKVGYSTHKVLWADIGETSDLSVGIRSPMDFQKPSVDYDLQLPSDPSQSSLGGLVGTDGILGSILETEETGAKMVFASTEGTINVAMAESPTDLRLVDPQVLSLVQVVAAGSFYPWMGDRVAKTGQKVGFVGSNHSRQYPGDQPQVFTAIRVEQGQDWFSSLSKGQTWVSVGSKILLDVPSRIPNATVRDIQFGVTADERIISIAVFKNGSQVAELVKGEPDPALVALAVQSESKPFSPIKSKPRNAREWIGYLAARDANLMPPIQVPSGWQMKLSADGRRLDFFTRTHGNVAEFVLPIENLVADSILEIGLAEVVEDAAWLPRDRMPGSVRARNLLISSAELNEGVSADIEVSGYTDKVSLRRLPLADTREGRFTYADPSVPRFGDYYTLVVRLINGAYAVSSPIYLDYQATN